MRRKKANAAGRAAVFCFLIAVLAALCAAASAGTLVLPARTTRIEDRTFYGSKALDEVDLAEPLSYIGHQAFAQSSVRYVYLPKSLTRIEDDAFEGCPNLVCLVEEGSYARRWCEARGVAWRGADYTESISPADGSVTVKNGAKLSSAVRTVPAGAVKRLVWVSSDSNIVSVDQNGEAYNAENGDIRAKMIDDKLEVLDLSMMYPAGNKMAEYMQEEGMFADNLEKVGIKITFVPEPMESLLRYYYRETERTTDMIYLATNFHVIVDPSITYSADPTPNHLIWNNTYSDDEKLYELAVDMRQTEPGDSYAYVSKWIQFQKRYNEVLPAIPVYTNIYFDFWTPVLQNYDITKRVTWTQAILLAYFQTPEEAAAEEEAALDLEEGDELFD